MSKKVKFNVLHTMCKLSKSLEESQLNKTKIKEFKTELTQLKTYFDTTDDETYILIAIFTLKYKDRGLFTLGDIASFFGIKPIEVLQYQKSFLSLFEKEYIQYRKQHTYERKKPFNIPMDIEASFDFNFFVEQAILKNITIPMQRQKNEEMTNDAFVKLIAYILDDVVDDNDTTTHYEAWDEIEKIEEKYAAVPVVQKSSCILHEKKDRMLFYMICNSYNVNYNKARTLKEYLDGIYSLQSEKIKVANQCREKIHPLFTNELIKFSESNDIFDLDVTLDEGGKDIFLDEYTKLFEIQKNRKDLITPEKITEKTLFFKPDLEKQVNFLTSTLEETSFKNLRARLEKEKFPQGVCALFYGSPGTGKTETVYQLAKATGRSIVHVDISQSKSMWFGESEKKIKKIFQDYKRLCKECDIKPILLFNEADAIFSKRKESHTSSVAQTENAMQNIILEEMEKLDGILIATTNLTGNLDAAFERRFLFKIEFEKPTVEAKINIWKNKMPKLSKKKATVLANSYDFSGGEIDNIVRKCIMDEVISGKKASLEDIETLCKQEHINKQRSAKRIGFRV